MTPYINALSITKGGQITDPSPRLKITVPLPDCKMADA